MLLINKSMDKDKFLILRRAAERLLKGRGILLGDGFEVVLEIDTSLNDEGYAIDSSSSRAYLRAADGLAIFAAFGRFLRLSLFDGMGGFEPFFGTLDFTPVKKLRGMYFATHFGNFYHTAPIERVYEVIEDLALRGCNSLLVWFDMHHYGSMQEESAQSMVKRLRDILAYANSIGIGGSLTMLSNEGFSSSPEHLRAEWAVQNGYLSSPHSHYHVEICPSKKGGIDEIIRERREMLEYFADLKIDYVVYWPYDQGGCTCADCAPWGSNGFIKLLPHFKALIGEMMPSTEVIVSAWYFDLFTRGEWQGFCDAFARGELGNTKYVLSFFENGNMPDVPLPKDTEYIEFPEISMRGCSPWGGYGASHLAKFLDCTHAACKDIYSGAFPYSEGIFEDANKYIELALYSGEHKSAIDALRDYMRFEFCTDSDGLFEALLATEQTLERTRSRPGEHIKVAIADPSRVEEIRAAFEKYNELLPENVTSSRNFRIFYLRAVIDSEMMRNDGFAIRSELCQEAMRELEELYFATENTCAWVRPARGK